VSIIFGVRADPGYVIPPIAIFAYLAVIVLIIFLISVFLSWLVRTILNKFVEVRREKSWLQSFVLFLFFGVYIWVEKFNGFFFGSLESEKEAVFYWVGLILSLILGGVLGYFLSPKQK
jgi:hypothetical protein